MRTGFMLGLALATLTAAAVMTPPVEAASRAAPARPLLNVAPDGIALVDPATGSSRTLAFGTPRAIAGGAVTRALGKRLSAGSNAECGPGPLAYENYPGGLTLQFQDGRFAGWGLRKGMPKITNAAGIGIGSTRVALMRALDATIEQTSLGTEFTAGDLSGLLAGRARTARITAMWAGATCIAR